MRLLRRGDHADERGANLARELVERPSLDTARPALAFVDAMGVIERLDYQDLARRATRWAGLLAECGIRRGDRVVLSADSRPDWRLALLGIVKVGAVAVPVPASAGSEALRSAYTHCKAALAVTVTRDPELEDVSLLPVDELRARLDLQSLVVETADTDPDDPAVIVYSGLRGANPLGVVHTHGSCLAQVASAADWLDARPGDGVWCTATPGSAESIWNLLAVWGGGAELLLHEGALDAEQRVELLEPLGVSILWHTSAEYAALAEFEPEPWHDLSRLRLAISTDGRLDPAVEDTFSELYGRSIRQAYGAPETGIVLGFADDAPARRQVVGAALPGHDVAVQDEQGRDVPAGQPGELVVLGRPDGLFAGYWDDDRATKAAFRKGAFRTAVTATIDETGHVQLLHPSSDTVVALSDYRAARPDATHESEPETPPAEDVESERVAARPAPEERRPRVQPETAPEPRRRHTRAERRREREAQAMAREAARTVAEQLQLEELQRRRQQLALEEARRREDEARQKAERRAEKKRAKEARRAATAGERRPRPERPTDRDAQRAARQAESERRVAERVAEEQRRREEDARRREAKRGEQERQEFERREAERLERERAEQERREAERRRAERLEHERAAAEEQRRREHAERQAREQAEHERREAERREAERLEAERLEAERVAAEEQRRHEQAEQERREGERREAERLERERAAAEEQRRREQAEREAREQAEQRAAVAAEEQRRHEQAERQSRERAEQERHAAERREAERPARERAAAEAAERRQSEAADAARREEERAAAEQRKVAEVERRRAEAARADQERREAEAALLAEARQAEARAQAEDRRLALERERVAEANAEAERRREEWEQVVERERRAAEERRHPDDDAMRRAAEERRQADDEALRRARAEADRSRAAEEHGAVQAQQPREDEAARTAPPREERKVTSRWRRAEAEHEEPDVVHSSLLERMRAYGVSATPPSDAEPAEPEERDKPGEEHERAS